MITCEECGGECCRKLAVEIETPRRKGDFEDIKWYMYHPGTYVYIDVNGKWCLQWNIKCKHLKNGRCMIYEKRPPVCRIANVKECEKNEKDVRVFFNNVEELEKWMKTKKFK